MGMCSSPRSPASTRFVVPFARAGLGGGGSAQRSTQHQPVEQIHNLPPHLAQRSHLGALGRWTDRCTTSPGRAHEDSRGDWSVVGLGDVASGQ
eukprot:6959963-Alexandrium_andersonii.AAC.1